MFWMIGDVTVGFRGCGGVWVGAPNWVWGVVTVYFYQEH